MHLPHLYQNKDLNFNNGQNYYFGKKENEKPSTEDIKTKLDKMFRSPYYIYRLHVKITTTSDEFETTLIGKTNSKLITLDNKLINIKDIVSIEQIV